MSTDWTRLYAKHKGEWVALSADEQTVVGFGATARSALEQAKDAGHFDAILTHLPPRLTTFVGSFPDGVSL